MTMNTYTQWLNLDFDPFAPGSKSRDFYCSGHRQHLLDQIVEFSLYSNAMIAVTGPLGAGKTTLARNFSDRFADEAVCVRVAATMFMNQNQFLESLQDALSFKPVAGSDIADAIDQVCQYAAELDLEARSLILIIDDAHELSAEVLQLLTKLLESCVDSSIHALLFGENQLDSLLQSTLSAEAQERLAVFPLDGFASDETLEYIRFKLATAGFTKELPISGGIVGDIYNSSQGMPGAINSLTVSALNAAAPASEPDEFADVGPIYSGDRIEQLEEYGEIESLSAYDRDEEEDERVVERSAPVWIANMQPKYWAAAATLVVLLTVTLLFWDTAPSEVETMPIAVAVTPNAQDIEVASQAQAGLVAAPGELLTTRDLVAEAEEVVTTEVASLEDSVRAEPEDVAPAEALVASSAPVPEITEPVAAAAPVVEALEVEETAVLATASPFVERLLEASPGNYAVQLLASHSEANISRFVAELGGSQPAGYFETRFQGKPWFVAVLAVFEDRDQASRAIDSMPAKLRSNEPWIRSVASIQTDIRALLGSKLVSSK